MSPALPLMMFMSVLFPSKLWYAPNQPITINVKPAGEVQLVLTDFAGKTIEAGAAANISGETTVDLKQVFPQIMTLPGTYVLWAVPQGQQLPNFVGTPLVIEVRNDRRRDAPPGPVVIRVAPLRYAVIGTDQGDMTVAFFYAEAPNTVSNFLTLAQGGFYDGLSFHRIVSGFVLQAGDPVGFDSQRAGSGGPGYEVDQEFNAREHREGVLSMARQGDPIERQGTMPRYQAANSAGSQFFICLNYERTKQLDRRYTAFGQVVEGLEVVQALGKTPVGEDGQTPIEKPVMKQVRVMPVDAQHTPYARMMDFSTGSTESPSATAPSTQPVAPITPMP